MLQFLPYALAAYGGYKGYRAAKDSGASGIGRILGGVGGATLGYYGGQMVPGVRQAGFGALGGVPTFTQLFSRGATMSPLAAGQSGALATSRAAAAKTGAVSGATTQGSAFGKIGDFFTRQRVADGVIIPGEREIDPFKAGLGIGAITYLSGAFEPKDVDVFQPTYNLGVARLAAERGDFKYIDPVTGQEKAYEKLYIPEADPRNQGTSRLGPYAVERTTFKAKTGGLAEIKKFNEGGINYLPSKQSHDENDPTNYVRATGYVEDGSGTGDKDEDTMLAQLADGEFVTRADGVLGAGIINGGNPNSMKDMREKGAAFFYDQQKKYKRVFDLLKEANGINKKKN